MKNNPKSYIKVFAIFIAVAVLFWFSDAFYKSRFFRQELIMQLNQPPRTFSEALFSKITQQELSIRIFFFSLCIMGGAIVSWFVKRDQARSDALRESEERYRLAIDAANDGIFDYNIQTGQTKLSSKIYTILGYAPYELPESLSSFKKLLHPDERRQVIEKMVKYINQGKPYSIEFRMRARTGEWHWINARGNIISYTANDMPLRLVGTHTDITHLKETEKALLAAKEKAEESDRLKSSFLANMSHEIRTPLNGIMGFSDLLKQTSEPHSLHYEYANIIALCGNNLLILINDILDISKIESGQVNIINCEFSLNRMLDDLHKIFKPQVSGENNKVELKINKPLDDNSSMVNSDDSKLRQIFTNLIGNALKFTHEGFVEFGYDILEGKIKFYVKDTGIGIPESKHETIFQPFRQADEALSKKYSGTGLGLAIVKSFVEILGGTIKLDSQENVGSMFFFYLPLKPYCKTSEKKIAKKFPKFDWTGKKILIVEDDNVNFMLMKKVLSQANPEIIRATSGNEALELCLNSKDLDIVLMDIRLPDINGWDVTEKVREHNQELPIIAQTANAMVEDKRKSFNAGCTDYLTKPITREILMETVDNYINKPDKHKH